MDNSSVESLKDRLHVFLSTKTIKSIRSLETELGLSNGAINSIGNNPRRSTINKLSKKFPDINIGWLLTGKGEMTMPVDPAPDIKTDSYEEIAKVLVETNAKLAQLAESQQRTIENLIKNK